MRTGAIWCSFLFFVYVFTVLLFCCLFVYCFLLLIVFCLFFLLFNYCGAVCVFCPFALSLIPTAFGYARWAAAICHCVV
ncbi:putative mucin-associated surface protein (MASP) [Trypanosoma cruzi Dm28c]|uniref:Putative mucin-associated surface protein (MASP) n=1 Tax=Trypanosoma cruzi Dm28c TaxID=1416333 RepID=V5A856_TRYCR|nr:putative mucin-associated surface protein (MASP) [Trypanosoma cruzi Dm28c]